MDQFDLFNSVDLNIDKKRQVEAINIPNGQYVLIPHFFDEKISTRYLSIFKETILWKQESLKMYGKLINFPRLTSWYGDQDKPYAFSGITLYPNEWTSDLVTLKKDIEQIAKTQFNSVLLNLYRNGTDSISWHTDAEPELGRNPTIASVNFGATRKFQLRHIETKQKIEINLSHGSLLIMRGELQHYWQHQIPKTAKPVYERINLTFRKIY